MGCCQSEASVSSLAPQPQKYPQKIDLTKIQIAFPKTGLITTDRNSAFTLNLKLNDLIEHYEDNKGLISSYSILSHQDKTFCLQFLSTPSQNNQKQRLQLQNPSLHDTLSSYTQSSEGENSCLRKTKLLTNRSIDSEIELEKKLFYINSSEFAGLKFEEWSDRNRVPIQFTQQFLDQLSSKDLKYQVFVAIVSIYHYQVEKSIRLISKKYQPFKNGLRVFFNGNKRLLTNSHQNTSDYSLFQNYNKIIPILPPLYPCLAIFFLTGWIPEILDLGKISDKREVLNRLASNFTNCTLIISFCKPNSNGDNEYFILDETCPEKDELKVVPLVRGGKKFSEEKVQIRKWQDIVQNFPILNINWNPTLYGACQKIETTINQPDKKYYKFALRIRPSKVDCEIRIMIERHFICEDEKITNFSVSLYDFQPWGSDERQGQALKKGVSLNNKLLSDTLIFESSFQQNTYIVCLQVNEVSKTPQNNQFTLVLYSFVSVSIRNFDQKNHEISRTHSALMKEQNTGYGINSPFFSKNLHYSVTLPVKYHCKILAILKGHGDICLALIPDQKNSQDISLIKIQKIAHEFLQSEVGQTEASLQFISEYENYLLIVISSKPLEAELDLKISVCDAFSEKTINSISVSEVKFQPKFSLQRPFSWKADCPGPRKRLSSNSESIFYKQQIFAQFFKNPYIDEVITSGCYQFSVVCKSFEQETEKGLGSETKNSAFMDTLSPPSLSLAIFGVSEDGKKFKIILDDSFYVPFGLGFWSQPVSLQKGKYRIVMPKMQKKDDQGVLRMRRLDMTNLKEES